MDNIAVADALTGGRNEIRFCECCNKRVKTVITNIVEEYNVCGEMIEVKARVRICPFCGEDFFSEELDNDTLLMAYDEYRKRHKLLLPAEIKEIREQYGLSQRSFARILNWGDKTINRYENGSIQDKVHNSLLLFLRKPENMREYIRDNEILIEDKVRQKLFLAIEKLEAGKDISDEVTCMKSELVKSEPKISERMIFTSVNNAPLNNDPVNNDPVNNESLNNESLNNELLNNELLNNELLNNELVNKGFDNKDLESLDTHAGSFNFEQFFSDKPDINNGYNSFDYRKFAAMVLYFSKKSKELLKTKLMKLLNYSDMVYYKRYGISISGMRYVHLPYGPVPENFDLLLGALSADKVAHIEVDYDNGYEKHHIVPDMEIDEKKNCLSEKEIEVLKIVEKQFHNYGSVEISNYSHQEKGYKSTRQGEVISYEYAADLSIG